MQHSQVGRGSSPSYYLVLPLLGLKLVHCPPKHSPQADKVAYHLGYSGGAVARKLPENLTSKLCDWVLPSLDLHPTNLLLNFATEEP